MKMLNVCMKMYYIYEYSKLVDQGINNKLSQINSMQGMFFYMIGVIVQISEQQECINLYNLLLIRSLKYYRNDLTRSLHTKKKIKRKFKLEQFEITSSQSFSEVEATWNLYKLCIIQLNKFRNTGHLWIQNLRCRLILKRFQQNEDQYIYAWLLDFFLGPPPQFSTQGRIYINEI
eukprot:TRINITY_DN5001_c0_g2_i6.p4 TRINITY_DN5001_c0_g2~~TRINITY_DN5001_c0_g2_i6.p4  ORF type:complete len:175 (-),score=0.33 TRINITY_DN5001_c0_g2_i6:958-1482(-)